MTIADLDQVLAIDRQSFSLSWPESAYRYEILDNLNSICKVAETQDSNNGHQIIGLLVIWVILDEAHIATIATHPEYRQKGVAAKLLAASLLECLERGVRSATLEVRENNLAAQNLYKNFRFDVVGRRPRYYRDNFEDALLMTAANIDTAEYTVWLEQILEDKPGDPPLLSKSNEDSFRGDE